MNKASGRDVSPLVMPWLTEKYIPDVDARVDGHVKVIVTPDAADRTIRSAD